MKKIISIFLVAFMFICELSPIPVYAEEAPPTEPTVIDETAIVMNADTGDILYDKDAKKRMQPASLTKIMTVLLALEKGDLNSTVTMSETAVNSVDPGSSNIGLSAGEEIKLQDALYATFLESANEASNGVAEHIAGSVEAYCGMMNERAKEIGCLDTNFVNPSGLSNDNHYSTAYDIALMAREAYKNEQFMTIAKSRTYNIPATNKSEAREIAISNKMVWKDTEYYYENCVAGKTGYTTASGATLVSWVEKDGVTLICVVMNAPSNAENYADTKALCDYCFVNYKTATPLVDYVFSEDFIEQAEETLNSYYVEGKNLGELVLSVDTSVTVTVPASYDTNTFIKTASLSTERVNEGVIGTITISSPTELYKEVPIKFSGYINSEDEAAVEAAIAAGIIERPKEKKKNVLGTILKILLIIVLIGAIGIGALYMRYRYVMKQRALYRKRRDMARKQGTRF